MAEMCNGICSDMAIKTTYMRHEHVHGKSGIIGLTLNQNALKLWAYSLQACTKVVNGLIHMWNNLNITCQTDHKEKGTR